METAELMETLLDLAREVDLEVRLVGETDGALTSALCRVRGRTWVVLSRSDPAPAQIEVLVQGLRATAGDALDGRYLPPAVRDLLDGEPPGAS
ncbi:MAG: hypothetical protein QNK04_24325 [Myxococcota bacterium]|nr:hypothetical protein [Myxococcota bacterium]